MKVRKFEYLVKCKNYDRIEYNTWELADGLEGADEIIKKIEKDLEVKNRKGKLKADEEITNTKTDNKLKKSLHAKDQKYQKDCLEVQKRSGKLKADTETANKKTDEKLKRTSYVRSEKYQNGDDETEYRSKDQHRQMPLEGNIPESKSFKSLQLMLKQQMMLK